MVRVQSRHHGAHQVAHSSAMLDRNKAARKKKPYKVVMEVVTQEKKKLRSVMAYSAQSPPGYTFVPLGHPELTEYCKEKCRRRNLEAHIVTAQPKNKKNGDAQRETVYVPLIDTQRIGHHFPNQVIDEACDVLGYIWRNGTFHKSSRNYEETRLARSLRDYGQRLQLHGRPMTEKETKDQIRIAILEVFPKIPQADLDGVLSHAFEEGTNRVGNAKDLTLARRVQLAVGAFIRHQYTNYDTILKTGGTWPEARASVQSITYGKLKEWRDEADNSNELEETFREIIVLDDEDDDSVTTDDMSSGDREESLEIISSQATARELQPDNSAYYSQMSQPVSRRTRRLIYLEPMKPSARPRHELNRHAVLIPTGSAQMPQRPDHYAQPVHSYASRSHVEPQRALAPPRTKLVQASDGKWYNLEPIDGPQMVPRKVTGNNSGAVEYVPSRPPSITPFSPRNGIQQSPQHNVLASRMERLYPNRPSQLPMSSRESKEDVVLPSIEQPDLGAIASPRRAADSARPGFHDQQHPTMLSPKRKDFEPIFIDDDSPRYDNPAKRLRPADQPVSLHKQSHSSSFAHPYSHPTEASYSRPRAQQAFRPPPRPTDQIIDLTSSPIRRSDREVDSRTASAFGRVSYAHAPQRMMPDPLPVYDGRIHTRLEPGFQYINSHPTTENGYKRGRFH